MKKIILTIIILAVTKSIFAAPNPTYSDATKLQTVPFDITRSADIQERIDKLAASDTFAINTANEAKIMADLEPTGNDALKKIKRINNLILDKGSCLYNANDCTQDNVDYIPSEAFSGYLPGTPGQRYPWEAPAGVTSVVLRLRGGGGGGYHRDSGNSWFGNFLGDIIGFGGKTKIFRGEERGQAIEVLKTVTVTPGEKITYHIGIPEYLNSGTTLKYPEGTIHMTYKVNR